MFAVTGEQNDVYKCLNKNKFNYNRDQVTVQQSDFYYYSGRRWMRGEYPSWESGGLRKFTFEDRTTRARSNGWRRERLGEHQVADECELYLNPLCIGSGQDRCPLTRIKRLRFTLRSPIYTPPESVESTWILPLLIPLLSSCTLPLRSIRTLLGIAVRWIIWTIS